MIPAEPHYDFELAGGVEAPMNTAAMSPDSFRPNEAVAPLTCVAIGCENIGSQMVIYESPARWLSGRYTRGHLIHEVVVCEEHFEILLQGGDVHI